MSARFDPLTEMTIQRDTLMLALRDVYDKLDAARAELRSLQVQQPAPVEPGNATERICGYVDASVDCTPPDLPQSGFRYIQTTESVVAQICADVFLPEVVRAEVAAALRMYRKVQGCKVEGREVVVEYGVCISATNLLAWLKEGEA